MHDILKRFPTDEGGAVTVDWVVLTAAIGFLAVGIAAGISSAAIEPADSVGNQLSEMVTE
ncbi:hypothetical protein [Pseudoroseicyclus tamaricis]|uniref:Pilus assembly protein n=1 Tax=Pseudoroseicyclus tamaricis TaxID=2705421 RepID=A0A6B2JTA8_9RHOB|nr:hypothetical protein [Pseudoroseicyclus tamaricis]NDV01787.1 hypothetical protein [Pseudoroseicyclus tamaricis]